MNNINFSDIKQMICVDDTNKPNEIPAYKWVKKGQPYTPSKLMFMKMQGIYGIQIEEIDLSDCFPYTYFSLNRFGISLDELKRLVKQGELELEEV